MQLPYYKLRRGGLATKEKTLKIVSCKEVDRRDCLTELDRTCTAPLHYRTSEACEVISVTFKTGLRYIRHCPQKVIHSAGYNQVPKSLRAPGRARGEYHGECPGQQ